MNRPLDTVTVSLPAIAVRDLELRVAAGEFASLEDAMVAELLDLEHRRAVEMLGGQDAFDALVAELPDDDPTTKVDAFEFLQKLRDEFAEMAAARGHNRPEGRSCPRL